MAISAEITNALAAKFAEMLPHLDERQRRLYLGSEARALGRGGIAAVARAAKVSELTVSAGVAELEAGAEPLGRARRPGGGRKRAEEKDPGLARALRELVEESTRGDPQSPLRWTTLSLRELAAGLTARGHPCGADTAGRLLRQDGFSLRGNAKTIEGRQHPDRDAQFRYIAARAEEFMAAGQPVISVDAKKKEQVGPYAQAGRTWRPKGDPVRVRDHSFPDQELGKVTPYGVYDVAANTGFVNVGTDHETAAFAVESIRRWWLAIGQGAYPGAGRLLITADAGGSNGYRCWAWKAGLAALAVQTGLEITCCHFPPGTSKWNKIEHRLFSAITRNWRGRPLVSHEVIVNTIAAVTTATGLTVTAMLDTGKYPVKVKVSSKQITDLRERALRRHGFHGSWNYAISPAAPAPPDPPPAPAGHDLGVLAHPALTGVPDFAALVTDMTLAWEAAREQRLYLIRGGRRRRNSGPAGPTRLSLHGHVLATIYRQRLGMPCHLIGRLLGVDESTVSLATCRTAPLLEQQGITITPAGTRISTLGALHDYAAAAGITLPEPKTRAANRANASTNQAQNAQS
jgi:DDE family transposase